MKNTFALLLFAFVVVSCIPKRASVMINPSCSGKPPKFSNESILLGEMTSFRSCYDVYYYDLYLNINPNEKLLDGEVIMFASMLKESDTLQIDLDDTFKIKELVNANTGEPLSYWRKERAVFISFKKNVGEKFAIKIKYEGHPHIAKKPPWNGGWIWSKDKNKKPWVGVACESDGASLWWPLKDHIADEPDSVRMHYTVPKGLIAVGNGQFEGEIQNRDSTTFNWYVSYPINTYNVTVYIGDYLTIKDNYQGIGGRELEISHYVLKDNYEKAKTHFAQIHKILKVFEERFGEYPWYNDGFKLVESPYAGMEHQTAIAYGNDYINFLDSTDYIILHETAHEWWGNSVSVKDMADVWIHEGFATYSEALYFEYYNDKDFYDRYLSAYQPLIKNEYPVVGIKDRRWFDAEKNADVYTKGAWILHSLRSQINNDSLFFDILKSFYENNKMQIIDSRSFIDLVNAKTNTDYEWFFKQYLFNNFSPELEYEISYTGKVFYRWDKVGEDFDKLKVEIKAGEELFNIIPSTEVKSFQLKEKIDGKWQFTIDNSVLYTLKHSPNLFSVNTYNRHK